MSLRTSREGFEGLGLQAKPRPAACRRIPRSPPVIVKRPLKLAGVLFLGGASDVPADIARGGDIYLMSVIPAYFAASASNVNIFSQPAEEAVRSIRQSAKSALPASKTLKARST